jgi:hypothetical protein
MLSVFCLGWVGFATPSLLAQLEFERPPIDYTRAEVHDPIAELQQAIDRGETQLEFTSERGYLDSLLEHFQIDPDSQTLVFSKTSFQLRRINPRQPRALYFNHDVYLGWVQNGDVVEIMSVDPQLGPVFYTLEQQNDQPPQFVRDRGQCLTCHASSRTQGIPGPLVRSVFVDRGGQPLLGSGTYTTDHRSPFEERWGGWYVSGKHGSMRHMGNELVQDRREPRSLDREAGANVEDLSTKINVAPYRVPSSDLVALMVLEHQSQMQNFITLANYETRMAEHYDDVMNRALERPLDHVSDSTQRRIASVGDKLLKCLLMVDEFSLEDPVQGSTGFSQKFQDQGPQDRRGRSLYHLDLQTRLFRYPCSYMIYTPSFDALPEAVRHYVAERLWKILEGVDEDPTFRHLELKDRRAIQEVLLETKPDLWPDRVTNVDG